MRKALAVLVLTIGSVLVLQAPAFAQHLYRINQIGTVFTGSGRHADYELLTNCPAKVSVISASFVPSTATPRFSGKFEVKVNDEVETWRRFTFTEALTSVANARAPKVTRATCDGEREAMRLASEAELPFTGVSALPQLALAAGLLLVGILLIVSSQHRTSRMPSGS
jgi:hypothetical protein